MGLFTKRHSKLTGDNLHGIVWEEVADTAARLALPVHSDDNGKVVHQLDDDSHWVLVDYSVPTYIELTAVGVAAVTSVFTRQGDVVAQSGDYTNAQVGLGNVENTKVNLAGTADPTITDDSGDGYSVGSTWINVSDDTAFIATDVSAGAAVWTEITGGAGGTGTWGFITGTITNQADLQAQFGTKADTSHVHSATDITSDTLDDARVAESSVTQHEAAIDHDALTNFVGEEHIRWDQAGAEQVDSSRYATGTGGATNTVSGATGITNTGDDVNAVLEPTYGATADTIAEGDDTRIVNSAVHATGDGSDHADVVTNAAGIATNASDIVTLAASTNANMNFGVGAWQWQDGALGAVGTGEFSTNSTTPSAVTVLKIYYNGLYETGQYAMFTDIQVGDRLFFACPDSTIIGGEPPTATYKVSGTSVDSPAGTFSIPVTYDGGNGGGFESTLYYGVNILRAEGGTGTGSAITVTDEGGAPLTTDVQSFDFVGGGVTATSVGDDVTVTIAPGAAPIDTVFGRTGTVVAVAGDYTASEVTNVPAGDIAATTVQGAIDELDSDKAPVSHTQVYNTVDGVPTNTMLGRDTAGTGPSEALSTTDARALLNVQDGATAAGVTGDAYATSHEADGTAHTAAEIVNTPAGGLAATDVQAALYEIYGDKADAVHGHTLSDISDSGTAAALDADNTIGNLPLLENVGGNPGMPAVDGSQLTDVPSEIEVVDESTSLTTDLIKLTFAGTGVEATEPTPDSGEILVTITSGAPGAVDVSDGTTTVSAADLITFDGTAFDVTDQGGNDALVEPIFSTTPGTIAEGDHTHDTLANVDNTSGNGVILGRDTAGVGLSEELTPTEARAVLEVEQGATADPDWESDQSGSPTIHIGNVAAATTTTVGLVELATDGEVAADVVVQGNDARLSDARTPVAHNQAYTTVDNIPTASILGRDDVGVGAAEALGAVAARAVMGLGTAAVGDTGVTVGDLVALVDVGAGTPGFPAVDGSLLEGIVVTGVDHGDLTGLTGGDDHTQYHNDARGDARYYTQTQADTLLSTKPTMFIQTADPTISDGAVDGDFWIEMP